MQLCLIHLLPLPTMAALQRLRGSIFHQCKILMDYSKKSIAVANLALTHTYDTTFVSGTSPIKSGKTFYEVCGTA